MSRYVALLAGTKITDWEDEVIVLSPQSRTYVGFRGAARDVLLVLRDSKESVNAAELARIAVASAPQSVTTMSLSDAEDAIDACFQLFIDEGFLSEGTR